MKTILSSLVSLCLILSCSSIKERLAIKECKFRLLSVSPHSFTFSDFKVDFDIKVDNPNNVDAILDKLAYSFFANNTKVFSGATGKTVNVKAKKSETFTTTITLEYNKIGQALAETMKLGSATYSMDGRAYVSTVLGEISYPVSIELQ
jgi:LEA14-like dessication related protein